MLTPLVILGITATIISVVIVISLYFRDLR